MKPEIFIVNNSALMQAFLAVPSLVYGQEDIPPSVNSSTNTGFLRFSPTLQHIRFANFVAIEDGQPVGRITASIDYLNPRPDEGFWGCFECTDRPEIAKELLDSAAEWLREQDKTIMIGPATLNTNQLVGLLIEGFEYLPQKEIPYNPPYYQNLIEEAGLEKIHDLECFRWELPETLPSELERVKSIPNIVLRSVNYRAISREARIFHEIHNKAMSKIWGFIPLTISESQGFLMSLASHVPPELFIICEVEGEPAGMLLSIPYQKPCSDGTGGMVRHAIGAVMPNFRGRGLHLIGLIESFKRCKRLGYTKGEASQVAESNKTVKKVVINPIFGGEIIKLFRVYKRTLMESRVNVQ